MGAPTLVVLAAGIGSRYGGFKQIEPLGPHGEIVLDYSLYDAWRAGFRAVVFVVRRELEQAVRDHFAPSLAGRLEATYVNQEMGDLPAGFAVPAGRVKPWGTAHAVWTARQTVRGPFAVINADDYYGTRSYAVLGGFLAGLPEPAAGGLPTYAMVGFVLRNTLSEHGSVSRGICRADADGFLSEVVERTRIEPAAGGTARFQDERQAWLALSGDEIASMNMWGFDPSLFACLTPRFEAFLRERQADLKAEFFLPTVVDALIRARQCRTLVLRTTDPWFGITYPQDRPVVQAGIRRLIDEGVYPGQLWG